MTSKTDFTEQEWDLVLSGPPTAGMMVITADRGGMMRETFAMAKAYAEARQQHGASRLLDDIVSAKPEMNRPHASSSEEFRAQGLQRLRDAVELLQAKATPDEVDEYRRFILNLTDRVARRHKEHGAEVSDTEQAVIDEISQALSGAAAV